MAKTKPTQDWPNLNRYSIENEKIAMHPLKENRIVFMGDSITEGWSSIDPEFFSEKPYINRGIGGQTTPQMLLRFRADVINLQPKITVILGGTNDIAGNTGFSTPEMILNNIISMVELAKSNSIKVVLCSILPANHFYWNPGIKPAGEIIKSNHMIESYARTNNIPYADYHTAMKDPKDGLSKEYGSDGVHPNIDGYKIMGEVLEKTLQNCFK